MSIKNDYVLLVVVLCVFETGSQYVALTGLELYVDWPEKLQNSACFCLSNTNHSEFTVHIFKLYS